MDNNTNTKKPAPPAGTEWEQATAIAKTLYWALKGLHEITNSRMADGELFSALLNAEDALLLAENYWPMVEEG